uniref:Pre-rRNA-processing protein TSR2 homolog n=1 Tax=Amblyomma triste TaxID=251400 RepID=A0A023GFS4_AMBTT
MHECMAGYGMASESAFHVSVKTLIGDWHGLQVAIENGMGGPQAREKEQWLVGVLEQYFAENSNLHPDEVADLIAEIIDNEFDTIIEDGSLGQISALLCKHYQMCKEGRENEVLQALSQRLPPTKTLRVPFADEYDSDDEAEMQNHINTEVSSQLGDLQLNGPGPSHQQSRRQEPDEDGWTVVRHGKRT